MKAHMTLPISVFAALVALKTGAILPAHAQHAHQESTHEPSGRSGSAQRFATDAPLREGMARIHSALDDLRHYEMGHMPQPLAIEQVAAIQSAVDTLFATCKLEPEADAALHGMLVPLITAVQAFKTNPDDLGSIARMRQAIADYARLFDDSPSRYAPGADSDPAH
ncbi:MAG: DnrO protein [Dokdonella sp.]